jgi:hypothetical protein
MSVPSEQGGELILFSQQESHCLPMIRLQQPAQPCRATNVRQLKHFSMRRWLPQQQLIFPWCGLSERFEPQILLIQE